MIVPQFWAEARAQAVQSGRTVRVRRFGWSDTSQVEAQANADVRAADALRRLLAGESVYRSEPKVPYNGAAGVPIREEIVVRNGDTVITRNSYGARCLNSPNALFADIDLLPASLSSFGCFLTVLAGGGAFYAGWRAGSTLLGAALAVFTLIATQHVVVRAHRAREAQAGGAEGVARTRLARFLAEHPDWALRVYRTPAGLRVLVTHQPFEPNDPAVQQFFAAVGTDPMYVRMCLNQQCFRARVSPKPWRIGIETRMRPRPGVWPVRPERLKERNDWIAAYERAAQSYAACEFIEAVGSGIVHPAVGQVQKLHDDLCRAMSGLPIA